MRWGHRETHCGAKQARAGIDKPGSGRTAKDGTIIGDGKARARLKKVSGGKHRKGPLVAWRAAGAAHHGSTEASCFGEKGRHCRGERG